MFVYSILYKQTKMILRRNFFLDISNRKLAAGFLNERVWKRKLSLPVYHEVSVDYMPYRYIEVRKTGLVK